jgi:hypothetical protein
MKNVKKFSMFEKQSNLSDKERERLERLERNAESWRNQFRKYADQKKGMKFLEHWDILDYIKEEPDLMASILVKLLDVPEFNEWMSVVMDEIPETFKDSMGIASEIGRAHV